MCQICEALGHNIHLGQSSNSATSNGQSTDAAASFASISTMANFLVEGYWGTGNGHRWAAGVVTVNIDDLNSAEQTLAILALNAYSEVCNISFSFIHSAAQITYNNNGSGSAATSSNWSGGFLTNATIQISSNWWPNTLVYSYMYQTYLHETGHALGLGHQGPYNGSATYGVQNIYTNDTWQWSVMSYFSQANFGGTYDYVITPEMVDIYAVQLLYGARNTTRTGDTTYGFNSNAGSIFDFNQYSGTPAFTIYDCGGNDTLDCSGYSNDQTIRLWQGGWSSIGGFTNNVGIYLTTVIENGVGGSGNDYFYGNEIGNILVGNGGNDTFEGYLGDDTLYGGAGTDTAVFSSARGNYNVSVNGDNSIRIAAAGGVTDGTDTLYDIELFRFADRTYTVFELLGISAGYVAITNSAVREGNGGTTIMTFMVTRTGGTLGFSVNYSTADGTATTADGDYVATSGTLQFGAGENSKSISVTINGDTRIENHKSFFVNLFGLTNGATLANSSGQGFIADDDASQAFRARNDFNSDGVSDVLWNHTSGAAYEWQLSGSTIIGEGFIGNNGDANWKIITSGDFNGDGRSDVLWQNSATGQAYQYQMSGTSIIGQGFVGNNNSTSWKIVTSGDFDGDGRSDIIWQNSATGQVYLYRMSGTSIIGEGFVGNNNSSAWKVVASSDFNRDGRSDIIWQNSATGQAYQYQLNGNSIIGEGFVGNNNDPNWKIVTAADFNGDGFADLLWQNSVSGQVYQFRMNGTSIIGQGFVGNNTDANWKVVGAGDFNYDGRADILWQNSVTGQAYQWLLDGTSVIGAGFVGNNQDSNWHAILKT